MINNSKTLVVLPSLRGKIVENGKIRITGKFLKGMASYADYWPGRVTAILHPDYSDSSGNLDDIVVAPDQLSFDLEVMSFDSQELLETINKRALVVQGGADYLLNRVPEFCKRQGIPYVFVAEYTLRTRLQIVDAETVNPVLRFRRGLWARNQERWNRRNVQYSAAVQCNGTPTFEAYASLNPNTILFFDSRTSEEMLVAMPSLAGRLDGLRNKEPIRLGFAGRLNEMKGADDLVRVAIHLRNLGVPFVFDICGNGVLAPSLLKKIEEEGLGNQVRIRGVLDFQTELVPFMSKEIDLFVCCHRQGDPSCTYLETFACGVPIAGYSNEAFVGLLKQCQGGWSSPINDPVALATNIASIYSDPSRLLEAANQAVRFSRGHTVERTFKLRVEQMLKCGRQAAVPVME